MNAMIRYLNRKTIVFRSALVWVCICIAVSLSGQNAISSNSLIHIDKPYYVAGECIWFKLYLSPLVSNKSISIKTVITNDQGVILNDFFLQSQRQSFVQGYFKIPHNYRSGIYPIHFLIKDSITNQTTLMASVETPIYNDLENATIDTALLSTTTVATTSSDLNLKLSIDKNSYTTRSPVRVQVLVKDREGRPVQGNLSISVYDRSLIPNDETRYPTVISGASHAKTNFSAQFFYSFNPTVHTTDITRNVFGVFMPREWKVRYASNRGGTLHLDLPAFQNQKDIQLLASPDANLKLAPVALFKYSVKSKLIYTKEILNYIECSKRRKKIYQLYTTTESPVLPAVINEKIISEVIPDRTLLANKYEAFEDLATFFKEINTPLAFKLQKKSNLYTATMYDPDTFDEYPEPPLMVVNGKIVKKIDFVARLKTAQIESIDLYYRLNNIFYYFKLLGRNGVIHIKTKSKMSIPEEYLNNVYTLSGLQPVAPFPDYTVETFQNKTNQPFYRPSIYWNAAVKTDAEGRAEIDFMHSDDLGRFGIQVVAQDTMGHYGIAEIPYIVK